MNPTFGLQVRSPAPDAAPEAGFRQGLRPGASASCARRGAQDAPCCFGSAGAGIRCPLAGPFSSFYSFSRQIISHLMPWCAQEAEALEQTSQSQACTVYRNSQVKCPRDSKMQRQGHLPWEWRQQELLQPLYHLTTACGTGPSERRSCGTVIQRRL